METPKKEDADERARANALAGLKHVDWPLQRALKEFQAQHIRQRYDAALKVGFNDAQALYLSTQVWPVC